MLATRIIPRARLTDRIDAIHLPVCIVLFLTVTGVLPPFDALILGYYDELGRGGLPIYSSTQSNLAVYSWRSHTGHGLIYRRPSLVLLKYGSSQPGNSGHIEKLIPDNV